MPENPTGLPEAENVRTIRQLVRLMKRYDLTAIDFVEGTTQIRLRRRGPETIQSSAPSPASHSATPPPITAPTTSAPALPPAPLGLGLVIESPMVGTYFASSSPNAPPFVVVGSQVRSDTTVCVIEAMKVFTDIPAGINGVVAEILVKNGQPVEYGQPLFRVNPA